MDEARAFAEEACRVLAQSEVVARDAARAFGDAFRRLRG